MINTLLLMKHHSISDVLFLLQNIILSTNSFTFYMLALLPYILMILLCIFLAVIM